MPSTPQLHQNSSKLTQAQIEGIKSVRCARKVADGGGLYLFVMPKGGRWWRYRYYFEGKEKLLALGVYPAVSLEMARARHQFSRALLSNGTDPSAVKRELGKSGFIIAARNWVENSM